MTRKANQPQIIFTRFDGIAEVLDQLEKRGWQVQYPALANSKETVFVDMLYRQPRGPFGRYRKTEWTVIVSLPS